MGAVENYRAGVSNFCKREFGTDVGDACRMAMRNEYKKVWE